LNDQIKKRSMEVVEIRPGGEQGHPPFGTPTSGRRNRQEEVKGHRNQEGKFVAIPNGRY